MKNKKALVILMIIILVIIIGTYFIIKNIQKENRKYKIESISEYKYFVVKENEQYGVIDNKGNKIIETKYKDVKIPNPEKSIFVCYEENRTKILNEKNEEIFTQYENIEPLRLKNISGNLMYEKSILKYSKNGKYGIINFEGKKLTKPIYEEIDTFQYKEGELLVKKDGKYGVINIKGKALVKNNYDKIETDKYYEDENGYRKDGYIVSNKTEQGYRYGYLNLEGKEIIETKYNDLYRILEIESEDIYIICAENGQYGLIKNDKKIIGNEYQSLTYSESSNTITAIKGKKYGVISIDGKTIIPFEYSQIDITGEYIYAKDEKEKITVFDAKGNKIELDENIAILNIEDTNYKIQIETKNNKTTYSIYENEKKLTQKQYTYIQYLFNNYFIASNSNGKLGIIDSKEKIKVEFSYNSIQQIDNTNMIQTINNSSNVTEIYSKEMKKISELKDAILKNKTDYIELYNDNEVKYISKDEREVKNTELFIQNKIFAKKVNNKWGFIDSNGKQIIEPKYEKVTEINKYGFAGIKLDGKWGAVNNEGKIIVEPKYEINTEEPNFISEYYEVIYGNGEIYYTK